MSVDLSGGLHESREFLYAEQPTDPEERESVNAWIWDESDEVGIPRIAIEAIADQWETHDIQCNIVFGDGRVFTIFEPGKVHDPLGADGKARVLGAGPLSFELVEPYQHWRMRLDGLAVASTVDARAAGERVPGPGTVPVKIEVDLHSVAPPWENGALLAEAGRVLREQIEGAFMSAPRFEQLCRMTGRIEVDGEVRELRGGALRVRRNGSRVIAGKFWGHFWASAVFPSGRGFGLNIYPPRKDGLPTYNEGYLYDGDGTLIPARVVEVSWLRRLSPKGEPVRAVLETEDGRTVTITGETVLPAHHPSMPGADFPTLSQSVVRWTLDGETANGMLERSSLAEDMDQ